MANKETKSGQQEQAEAEVEGFKEDSGPFVVAAETTRMPMVFLDADRAERPIIFPFQILGGPSRSPDPSLATV